MICKSKLFRWKNIEIQALNFTAKKIVQESKSINQNNMFNLFKKAEKNIQNINRYFEPKKSSQDIIAEIHESFDTANEKLLNDAKEILAGSYDIEKGERLNKIGFVSARKAVEASSLIEQKQKSKELAKLIEYYQINYPNNKFITVDKVKEICQKYGLICGEIRYYIGDVPEKNLAEIEKFKLKKQDMLKFKCGWIKYSGYGYIAVETKDDYTKWYGYLNSLGHIVQLPENIKTVYTPMGLMICASAKDFGTKNMRINDGYKLEVDDPIVLQPIHGGYLVVSKWGLEADDEGLINEILN